MSILQSFNDFLAGLKDGGCFTKPTTLVDPRAKGLGREKTARVLYRLAVGDLPRNRGLSRTCPTIDCGNPFHYRLTGRTFPKRHRLADRAVVISYEQEILEAFEDLDNPTIQTVVHHLVSFGLPVTVDDVTHVIDRNPKLKERNNA